MPSLSPKDRAPLCLFSYEEGRRCRTPRIASHPHFCFYHAQKESRANAAETLAQELDYFFSGDYLSACDLSTALSRLIPAVIHGHIKPRLARTVAYMLQTLLQSIHISQREYATAFGDHGLRNALRHSVNANHDHLFPPDPEPATADPEPADAVPEPQPPPPAPQPLAETPAQSPAQPAPRASVGAGLARPVRPPRTTRPNSRTRHSSPIPTPPNATPPQPLNPSAPPSLTHPAENPAPEAAHPERWEGSRPCSPTPTTAPPPPQPKPATPACDPYAVHFDHNYRLLVCGKLF